MKSYVKFWIIVMIFSLLLLPKVVVANNEEIKNTVEQYYQAYANQDMMTFINLKVINESTRQQVIAIINKEWSKMRVLSYSLSNINIETFKNTAFVEYHLKMKIAFTQSKKIIEVDDDMKAILVKYDDMWKILAVGQKDMIDDSLRKIALMNNKTNNNINGTILNTSAKDIKFNQKCGDGVCDDSEYTYCDVDCGDYEVVNLSSSENRSNENKCDYDHSFNGIENIDLNNQNLPKFILSAIGKNIMVELKVNDSVFYFNINKGSVKKVSKPEKINYIVSINACNLSAIMNGKMSFNDAYDKKYISIKGNDFKSKLKVFAGKLIFKIMSFFR